jgi:hypothetical protein
LLSDNYKLIRNLLNIGNIVVFTRIDLKEKVETILKVNGFESVLVFAFKDTQETITMRMLSFILKWIEPSTANLRSLYRERNSSRITLVGLILRKYIYTRLSNISALKNFIRFLYTSVTRKSFLIISFSEIPPKLDLLFVTSITNVESDLRLAIFYKKHHTPIIATARSWDNLVSKGILRFSPDIFLSHSKFMSETAVKNHRLHSKSVRTVVTPCYQKLFEPVNTERQNKCLQISYGCIGPFLNPDEVNFINLLCKISQKTDICLTIIQHPKFQHDLSNIDLGNIEIKTFDYLTSTLNDYYSFLATQNFIIASGTTLTLDALFSGTPILGLEFEVKVQDFWSSHLRSYDYLPHTKKLFENHQIPRIKNEAELIQYMTGEKQIDLDQYFNFDLEHIIGDKNKNFTTELINSIKELLIKN